MLDRDDISKLVEDQGLEFLGVSDLEVEGDYKRFRLWLDDGKHAGMSYLERHQEIRKDPRRLLPGACSAIVVGLNYYSHEKEQRPGPQIARYARLRDYHKVLRRRGEIVARRISELSDGAKTRVVVDSAPVLERALAVKTGSGFIGKNSMFISKEHGSFLLIFEILTTARLASTYVGWIDPSRRSEEGGCGSCRRCQVHCPTGALSSDYQVDANRCLAYWSIEHRGEVPFEFWQHFDKYLFGCDACQIVCPYNRGKNSGGLVSELTKLKSTLDLFEVATMSQPTYERIFGGTPATRAKRSGLRRNALIAMVVSGHPRCAEALDHAEKSSLELVRKTAVQARNYSGLT